MDVQKFIQLVAGGEASQAKDMLNDLLSSRAFESLDAKKQEIAQALYNNGENIEVQDTADSEDEELLTQEEFDALSEEDQELYLEALEQLDEISLKTATKAYKARAQKAYDTEDEKEINKQSAQSGRMIKKFGKAGYKAVDSVHRQFDNYKEEVELDEVSQKTAVKAYSARLGREDDDTGNTKSMKTMDRIHKKYGAKGVMRAATAADKEYGIHSADYTKKDFVGDYLSSKK